MSLHGKNFTLSNGTTIPAIAFGVGTKWYRPSSELQKLGVVHAIEIAMTGIKKAGSLLFHLDAAQMYRNYPEIQKALAPYARNEYYLTDKFESASPLNPYETLKKALKEELNISHVDLYLLHSPFIKKETHGYDLVGAWKYMEQLVDEGLAKTIGVSNFLVQDIQQILDSNPKYKPVVNQIEFHAYLQDQTPGIVEYCQKLGILVLGYGTLVPLRAGRPGPLDSVLEKLAKKHGKEQDQILWRWCLQRGVLPITTTSRPERVARYVGIFDFELSQAEVDEINSVGKQKISRQYWAPEYSHFDK